MDYTGMIQQVIQPVIKAVKGPASLILATALTSIGLNAFAADPYVSIVLTGQMYRKAYINQRLKPARECRQRTRQGVITSYSIHYTKLYEYPEKM